MRARQGDERFDMIGGMLTVRIHGHDMGEALRAGRISQPMQDRCALALIARQHVRRADRVVGGFAGKLLGRFRRCCRR